MAWVHGQAETKEATGLDPKMLEALEKMWADCGGDAAAIAGKSGLSADLIKATFGAFASGSHV